MLSQHSEATFCCAVKLTTLKLRWGRYSGVVLLLAPNVGVPKLGLERTGPWGDRVCYYTKGGSLFEELSQNSSLSEGVLYLKVSPVQRQSTIKMGSKDLDVVHQQTVLTMQGRGSLHCGEMC